MLWLSRPSLRKEWCEDMMDESSVHLTVEALRLEFRGRRKRSGVWVTACSMTKSGWGPWTGLEGAQVTVEPPRPRPHCSLTLPTPTDGTVVSSPARVTAAEPGVREEGSVARTLVQAGGPGRLAAGASPAHRAVTLASHADTAAWARGVHAVHCDTGRKSTDEYWTTQAGGFSKQNAMPALGQLHTMKEKDPGVHGSLDNTW